jgi:hypothetical protein
VKQKMDAAVKHGPFLANWITALQWELEVPVTKDDEIS